MKPKQANAPIKSGSSIPNWQDSNPFPPKGYIQPTASSTIDTRGWSPNLGPNDPQPRTANQSQAPAASWSPSFSEGRYSSRLFPALPSPRGNAPASPQRGMGWEDPT